MIRRTFDPPASVFGDYWMGKSQNDSDGKLARGLGRLREMLSESSKHDELHKQLTWLMKAVPYRGQLVTLFEILIGLRDAPHDDMWHNKLTAFLMKHTPPGALHIALGTPANDDGQAPCGGWLICDGYGEPYMASVWTDNEEWASHSFPHYRKEEAVAWLVTTMQAYALEHEQATGESASISVVSISLEDFDG